MSYSLKTAMGIVGLVVATQAAAQVTFYSRDGFRGESFTADREIRNMDRTGFNDRAQSAVVQGGSWQVCEDARFEGRCVVLQPGEYPSLSDMGQCPQWATFRGIARRCQTATAFPRMSYSASDRRPTAPACLPRYRGACCIMHASFGGIV